MSLPRGFFADYHCGDLFHGAMIGATWVRQPEFASAVNYPKRTAYLGPFRSFEEAVRADATLWAWSGSNGWNYNGIIYCLFPEYQTGVAWPYRDARWVEVYETAPAEVYERKWDGYRYVIVRV